MSSSKLALCMSMVVKLAILVLHRRGISLCFVAILAVLTLAGSPAYAARKLAFAVGIDVYDNLPSYEQLKNSASDALAVAQNFKILGYEVTYRDNLTRLKFISAWQTFLDKIGDHDIVALFLAGHGVEIEGENFLLPRDMPYIKFGRQEQIRSESINIAQLLLDVRDRHPDVVILVLDACRQNPLIPPEVRAAGVVRGGLAVGVVPPKGQFLMYSAGAGQTALDRLPGDDPGQHSIYVRNLLPLMRQANLTLPELARTLKQNVYQQAQNVHHEQLPAYYDNLIGNFCLVRCGPAVQPPAVGVPPPPGTVFRDRLKDGSECPYCPEMVVVPAGSFMMGSTPGEREWAVKQGAKQEWVDREKPQHHVEIAQRFAVGKYETTRGEFAAFVQATGHDTGNGCSWRAPGFAQTDRDPVVCVSWDDAKAYVAWLSERTGHQYRLPSEAEWEFAARAKTSTMRPWGDDWDNKAGCAYANSADLTAKEKFSAWRTMDCRDGQVYTAPVGSYSANGFGLHDMIGNAWEWVEDCYHDSYGEAGRPDDGSAWTGGDCGRRVLRGGSWSSKPEYLRSAVRLRFEPGIRFNFGGFRVARTLTP